MNVGQLRELLENVDDNVPVIIATQPSWPLALSITHVMLNTERENYDDTEGRWNDESPVVERLWIAAGDQSQNWDSPYAPTDVF
jgi:hypothetical protein